MQKRFQTRMSGSACCRLRKRFAAVLAVFLLWCFSCSGSENLKLSGETDCLICNISFSTIVSNIVPEKTAIDGRPLNTRFLPLPECPLCGGVFSDGVFSASESKILAAAVWTSDYQQLRSLDSWYRHARLLEAASHPDLEIAEAYLKASWASDHDLLLQNKYRQSALKFFLRHIEDAKANGDEITSADFSTFLKAGELLRQLKRFEEAARWFENMKTNPEFQNSFRPMIINHLIKLIEQKNSDMAPMPDGNRLHHAISAADQSAVEALLPGKELLDEFNLDDQTPLMLAVLKKQTEMVKLLMNAGSNPRIKNAKGKTALHMACETNNPEVAEILANDSELINITDSFSRTALHYAAISANARIIKLLSDKGADLMARDSSGNSLLHFMAQYIDDFADLELAKTVIGLFRDLDARNFNDFTPFHLAAGSGNQLMAGLLANAGANINARLPDGGNALFFCHPDMIAFLIELGVKTDTTNNIGQTAFVAARLSGNRRRIAQFKQTRSYRQQEKLFEIAGQKASVFSAIEAEDIDLLKKILQMDASQVNAKEKTLGESPLHRAVLKGNFSIFELLLKSGAKAGLTNDFLRTPLHYAAGAGNYEMVKSLCEAGANIFALDARGSTPMHDAATGRHQRVFSYLKNLGASDSTLNNEGLSPASLLEDEL